MRTPALRIIFFWDTICPVVAVSGKWVKVMVAFSKVPEDAVGKVVRIDSDGDALIAFEGELGGEQWVSKHNLGNISVLSRRRVTKVTPPRIRSCSCCSLSLFHSPPNPIKIHFNL